jgi:YebC/PmpR family DNA-binding regulatory protein
MAGHSKWANIKHRKGRQDAKRGKLFAKLIKAIEAAARQGGTDPAANPTLATAIQKAKDASVPKDNIERAIARGSGGLDGVDYEEIWYEGYAPGGVALYVHVLTDNRNRAASDVRAAFNRNNGSLGEPGSVGYLFEQKGYVLVAGDEDAVIEIEQAEVTQLPTTSVPVTAENAPKVLRLVDAVEDLEDVQAVYANFDIPDEVLSEVG